MQICGPWTICAFVSGLNVHLFVSALHQTCHSKCFSGPNKGVDILQTDCVYKMFLKAESVNMYCFSNIFKRNSDLHSLFIVPIRVWLLKSFIYKVIVHFPFDVYMFCCVESCKCFCNFAYQRGVCYHCAIDTVCIKNSFL